MLVLVNCVIKKCSDGCLIQLKGNETKTKLEGNRQTAAEEESNM